MTLTAHERETISERLAQIKAERDEITEKPTPAQMRLIADLDGEETDLIRRLAEQDAISERPE